MISLPSRDHAGSRSDEGSVVSLEAALPRAPSITHTCQAPVCGSIRFAATSFSFAGEMTGFKYSAPGSAGSGIAPVILPLRSNHVS